MVHLPIPHQHPRDGDENDDGGDHRVLVRDEGGGSIRDLRNAPDYDPVTYYGYGGSHGSGMGLLASSLGSGGGGRGSGSAGGGRTRSLSYGSYELRELQQQHPSPAHAPRQRLWSFDSSSTTSASASSAPPLLRGGSAKNLIVVPQSPAEEAFAHSRASPSLSSRSPSLRSPRLRALSDSAVRSMHASSSSVASLSPLEVLRGQHQQQHHQQQKGPPQQHQHQHQQPLHSALGYVPDLDNIDEESREMYNETKAHPQQGQDDDVLSPLPSHTVYDQSDMFSDTTEFLKDASQSSFGGDDFFAAGGGGGIIFRTLQPRHQRDPSISHTTTTMMGDGSSDIEMCRICGCCSVPQRCCYRPCRKLTCVCLAETVARFAPCFVLCGFQERTARVILKRLNILLIMLSLYQVAAGIFLGIVLTSPTLVDRTLPRQKGAPSIDTRDDEASGAGAVLSIVWDLNGKVFLSSLIGFCLICATVFSWRVVRFVSLVGALRYYWALNWVLPFQTFTVVCLFDYFHVTAVWIQQFWRDERMAWFRYWSCQPQDTYNTLCSVPLYDNATVEEAWCLLNYNSTDCVAIRDSAQARTLRFLNAVYYFGALWGLMLLFLLLLAMNTLEQIVSPALIQKSRQSNIAALLSLPLIIYAGLGVLVILANGNFYVASYFANFSWMGWGYVSVASLFLGAGILGIYIDSATIEKTSDKRKQLAAVWLFIGCLVSAGILLVVSFALTVAFSFYLGEVSISESTRAAIGCFFNEDCHGCNIPSMPPEKVCTSFTEADVDSIVRTQCKSVATLSVIFMIYCWSLIRFGFLIRKHLATYQIEYV